VKPPEITLAVFVCLFGGALLGIALRRALPKDHLSDDSKHLLEVAIGIIGTMAGLVLGLLVGSASGSFNAQNNEVVDVSAKTVMLDRILAHYGPEASESRVALRTAVVSALDRVWPQERSGRSRLDPEPGRDVLLDDIDGLSPKNAIQRSLKPQALTLVIDIAQTRWLMFEQQGSSVSLFLLVVVVFWFTTTFIGLGLFAPRNATVIATLGVCALSISGAILLVMEMSSPFQGLAQISSAPVRNAVAHLGQ
jgi:hypothetical protein